MNTRWGKNQNRGTPRKYSEEGCLCQLVVHLYDMLQSDLKTQPKPNPKPNKQTKKGCASKEALLRIWTHINHAILSCYTLMQ